MFSRHTHGIWAEWKGRQKRRRSAKNEQRNEEVSETGSGEILSFRRAHLYGMRRRAGPDDLDLRRNLYRTALRLASNPLHLSKQPDTVERTEGKEADEPEEGAYPYGGA